MRYIPDPHDINEIIEDNIFLSWFMKLSNHDLSHWSCFGPNAETTLTKVEKTSLLHAYEVNAVGPILVIKVKLIQRLYSLSVTLKIYAHSNQSCLWQLFLYFARNPFPFYLVETTSVRMLNS